MGQVITANRLRDGVVVFFGPDRGWVEKIADAAVFTAPEDVAGGLAASKKDEDGNVVLDVYAIEVASANGVVTPVRLREAIRAVGPTVHPEHGKSGVSAARVPSTAARNG